jgi:photosystem II stability/assembly factor-like uncharacterized protein
VKHILLGPGTGVIALAAALAALFGQNTNPTPAAQAPVAKPAQKWRVQYFYDEEKSAFNIADLQFPSATRGVAVGAIVTDGKNPKPTAVVTSDGGAHWQTVNIEEPPVSLYFLSENLGWMVTTKGLWQTTETGRNWRKLPKLPGQIFRVYFLDEKNGFAAGAKKKVYETHDAGQTWTSVAAAAEQPGNPDYSAYTWIAFATPTIGIVTGWNMPPRRDQRLPDWMDPEAAVSRRDFPHLSYSMETRDGGKTWKTASASLFGQVSRVRFSPQGIGLGLMEYGPSFRYPSEVYKIEGRTGKNQTLYRDRRFAVSDVWLTPDGTAYLAGTQVLGQARNVVPEKVRVLRSSDFSVWSEMAVDYKAVANRAILAIVDSQNMWMATDNGMILRYE